MLTLQRGSRGTDVAKAQTALNAKLVPSFLLTPLVVDGDFGKQTEKFVRFFQGITPGLVVDGIIGAATWVELEPYATAQELLWLDPAKIDPLLVDLYKGDGRTGAQVRTLRNAGRPWCGFWPKASEGLYYFGDPWLDEVWKEANSEEAADASGHQLGVDWFTMMYHYFIGHQDPVKQAELALRQWERVGGNTKAFMGFCLDVEEGGQRDTTTTQQLIDGVSEMAALIKRATGKVVFRYSGWWLAEKAPNDMMGCDYGVIAAYTPVLPLTHFTKTGVTPAKRFGWQYCGDGQEYLANYPGTSPGTGPEDITAVIADGGGDHAMCLMQKLAARS